MNENEVIEPIDEIEKIEEIEEIEETEQTELTESVETAEDSAEAAVPAPAPAEECHAAEEALRAEIETLRASLAAAAAAASRRETEIRCGRLLRERGISEELTAVLLAPGETEVPEETLLLRVVALSGAVEAAAVRTLREKTEGIRPGAGDPAPITGKMIRETPVARLMEIMT